MLTRNIFYQSLRVAYRGGYLSIHLVTAVFICLCLPLIQGRNWYSKNKGKALIQWWSKRTTEILGLTITEKGTSINTTSLFVANHISFLDIVILASMFPVTFLSKSTIRYWPVFGFIAYGFGVIFIQRNNKQILHSLTNSLSTALKQKRSLVLFPEGTTTIGLTVDKFHPSLFQAAINAGKPVQPVALRYHSNGEFDNTVAYIGKDNFIFTLISILAKKKTEVEVTICDAIDSSNMNRKELSDESHNLISQAIGAY